MVRLIENSRMGVCKYTIETVEDLKEIDAKNIEATSEAYLVDDGGLRVFILKSDKSGWTERASSSIGGLQPFNRDNL